VSGRPLLFAGPGGSSFAPGQLTTGRRLLEGPRVCAGLHRPRFPCIRGAFSGRAEDALLSVRG
jgi:hypothetical protein